MTNEKQTETETEKLDRLAQEITHAQTVVDKLETRMVKAARERLVELQEEWLESAPKYYITATVWVPVNVSLTVAARDAAEAQEVAEVALNNVSIRMFHDRSDDDERVYDLSEEQSDCEEPEVRDFSIKLQKTREVA